MLNSAAGQTKLVDMLQQSSVLPTDDSCKYNVQNQMTATLECSVVAVVNLDSKLLWACRNVQKGSSAVPSVDLSAVFAGDSASNFDISSHNEEQPEQLYGIIVDRTNFYAEAGGQVSDIGTFTVSVGENNQAIRLNVLDTQSLGPRDGEDIISSSHLETRAGDDGLPAVASVDIEHRRRVAPNHSMTHVLNQVLADVLGHSIDQKGSYVGETKFR